MDPNHHKSGRTARPWIALLFLSSALLNSQGCRGPAERRTQPGPVLRESSPAPEPIGAVEQRFAQMQANGPITKEQLFAIAIGRNAGLEAAEERALASNEAALASGAMPEPHVSWTEFLGEVETKVGPQERRFEVSQALPWYGALEAATRAAESNARAALSSISIAERLLIGRVETHLWRAELGERVGRLEQSRIALLESISATIDGRYRTGNAEYADLLRSRSEIERAIERREVALDQVERAHVLLRRELGLPRGAKLPVVALVETSSEAYQLTTLQIANALEQNPSLVKLEHQTEAAKERLEQAEFDRKPKFTLGAFLIDTGLADNPATPGSGSDASGIKLSLTLPIRKQKYDAQERGARHEIRALRKERTDMQLALEGDVSLALEDMQSAERRAKLIAASLLPRAQEVLDTTRAGYSSGRANYLDLIQAANSQIELKIELLRADVDREFARIQIETNLGRALQSRPAQPNTSEIEN